MMLLGEHLHVLVGSRPILRDISLRLTPGRVTAIIGPNGAGKSTLLRVLVGLMRPNCGQVKHGDMPVADLSARDRARQIGYLPQDVRAHWAINAQSLVALGRLPHRSPGFGNLSAADMDAVTHAMTVTDTLQFADRPVDTLSGGELARVMLARVLAGQPQWLLADEPFAALDIAHKHALAAPMRAAAAAGQGVVVVLHDLSLALRVADDAILLSDGRIVAQGLAKAVLAPEQLQPVFGARFAMAVAPDGMTDLVSAPCFP